MCSQTPVSPHQLLKSCAAISTQRDQQLHLFWFRTQLTVAGETLKEPLTVAGETLKEAEGKVMDGKIHNLSERPLQLHAGRLTGVRSL